MIFFVTFRQVNERVRELSEQSGAEPDLNAVLLDLYRHGHSVPEASNHELIRRLGSCDTATFLREKENLYIECNSAQLEYMVRHPDVTRVSSEVLALSERYEDVFLNFRFPRTQARLHPHPAFFEIDYVYAGEYSFTFENHEYLLHPGDLCIISPNSQHMIRESVPGEAGQASEQTAGGRADAASTVGGRAVTASTTGGSTGADMSGTDVKTTAGKQKTFTGPIFPRAGSENFIIQQFLDNDALHSTFISLLSDDNIVSNFFKNILTNAKRSNFLLLSTGESDNFPYIQRIAKDSFLEQFKYDDYAPGCNINLLKILFSNVLRSYRDSFQLYSGSTDIDFVPVLRYLEQNYRTTSLAETARIFHYSPSHLSSCIKQITGHTYTEMIRTLKMNEAQNYLTHSNKSIDEISRLVGYKTVDHFSRAFRQQFGIPPSVYRKEHRESV